MTITPATPASIAEIDATLSMLRTSWLAAPPEQSARWLSLIDNALDERLVLMGRRKPSSLHP